MCVPEHGLWISFQICGTRSKAFLVLFSFNFGMEKCVCKRVSPKSMLVASYKQGAETGKYRLYLPYPSVRAERDLGSKDKDTHITCIRDQRYTIRCTVQSNMPKN